MNYYFGFLLEFRIYSILTFHTLVFIFYYSIFLTLMPACKRIYRNCIWTVPPEWHGLNFYSALLTKVYWNYATDIIRVCVTAISPTTLKPNVKHKSNIHIRTGSKAMGSHYELVCHHSLQSLDPAIDLPTLSHRIFSTILFTRVQMTTPILPIPIYLLSTPMILPIFLKHFVNAGARLFLSSPKRQHL